MKIYSALEKMLLTAFLAGALTTGIMYKTHVKEQYTKIVGGITIGLWAARRVSEMTRNYSNEKFD